VTILELVPASVSSRMDGVDVHSTTQNRSAQSACRGCTQIWGGRHLEIALRQAKAPAASICQMGKLVHRIQRTYEHKGVLTARDF